jgi:hypothetical protein
VPPAASLAKPKLTPEERRARYADRLTKIRLRMLIFRELDARDITTPTEIGAAIGMSPAEAAKLLRGHQWRCWRRRRGWGCGCRTIPVARSPGARIVRGGSAKGPQSASGPQNGRKMTQYQGLIRQDPLINNQQ